MKGISSLGFFIGHNDILIGIDNWDKVFVSLGNIDEVVEIYSDEELNGLILVSYSNFIFENSSSEISSLFKKLECNGWGEIEDDGVDVEYWDFCFGGSFVFDMLDMFGGCDELFVFCWGGLFELLLDKLEFCDFANGLEILIFFK